MATFKNKYFTRRDYETMNVVFCEAETMPVTDWDGNAINDGRWVEVPASENTLESLFKCDGVLYFGHT